MEFVTLFIIHELIRTYEVLGTMFFVDFADTYVAKFALTFGGRTSETVQRAHRGVVRTPLVEADFFLN